MDSLGEKIRVARRVRGLTQEEAAHSLGFSRRAWAKWEHGSNPHPLHRAILEEAVDRWLREAAGL